MKTITHKVFPSQADIDRLNGQVPQGVRFQSEDLGGLLAMPSSSVQSILDNTNTIDPADVLFLEGLPEIEIPDMSINAVVGELYVLAPYTFALEGQATEGKWLTAATKSTIPSDQAPAVSPAKAACVSVTYSNEVDNSTQDLLFHVNGVLAFTWTVTNARIGYCSESRATPLLTLEPGDRLSVQIANLGVNSMKDGHIICYFALVEPAPIGTVYIPTL